MHVLAVSHVMVVGAVEDVGGVGVCTTGNTTRVKGWLLQTSPNLRMLYKHMYIHTG